MKIDVFLAGANPFDMMPTPVSWLTGQKKNADYEAGLMGNVKLFVAHHKELGITDKPGHESLLIWRKRDKVLS